MKIVISKETKNFMRCAKQISEIEGRETGFLFHYFNLPNQNHRNVREVFHTEMVIGDKASIRIRSKYQNFLSGLGDKIIICGSFHIHPYKKRLEGYKNSGVDKNRLEYIEKCCSGVLSFNDLDNLLTNIIKGDPKCGITCVLSDIEDTVLYYVPKKYISIEKFKDVHHRFKEDAQLSECIDTIDIQEDHMKFPTPEYRKTLKYILDLFEENRFDLNLEETIIDI